ncbi:MAG TPA: HAD-IIIC family phosphatase [Candidatus Baltobacteraceae bacterium]|nr:HAD-IIIC family phosphatase [Candidatus Baltobacteraceae bacterium]
MSSELYANLAWLPQPPPDFRARCRAVADDARADGRALAALANHALNENRLRQLADAVRALRARDGALAPLTPFTLGVVGNVTLEPLVPTLIGSAPRHGIALECVEGDFAQTVQEAMSPDSRINRARPDAVLLALDFRGLPLASGFYDGATARDVVAGAVAHVDALRAAFRANGGARVIVQTLAPPPESAFGSFDRIVPGTVRSLCAAFNAALVESVRDGEDVILDVATLAETVGLADWHSPRQWNVAKLPFDARFLPLYADHVCRVVGALRGKSRRCLILDLDNTLWGGVIGDDGLEGIVLGQGDWTGEAYLDVQRTALALRERGIVLAVSSKNDDAVARRPFAEHPDMLLREDHIAVFQANWNDKATNIAAIAEALSLGLDAMVFLDDNPVERGLVRQALPQVAVPELPADPALYARTLAAAGYFEAVTFSEEDRKRASFYQDNARRLALQGQIGDLDAYLASLQMRIVFRPFDATGRSRITQLVNKSNQFNLTTRRYDESEIARFEADPAALTLQVRLVDVYGDNGMISVIVCVPAGERTWEIDTWLMSCRVLGRRVEHMVLREIVEQARARGIERIVGRYLPTERNGMVRDHYAKLGFRLVSDVGGTTTWELDTADEPPAASMEVDRSGFELTTA